MARLHVLPPDSVTRVSEYVPEIVAFTKQIIDNGFAYEGGGSVWFDVAKFEGARQQDETGVWAHEYAKLQPGSKGNRKLLDEGEGEFSSIIGIELRCFPGRDGGWRMLALAMASWLMRRPTCNARRSIQDRSALSMRKLTNRRIDWLARQTPSVRFCTLESQVQAWRAVLAFALGRGPARMAHRVFRHGQCHFG
jgi:hypothetical protein